MICFTKRLSFDTVIEVWQARLALKGPFLTGWLLLLGTLPFDRHCRKMIPFGVYMALPLLPWIGYPLAKPGALPQGTNRGGGPGRGRCPNRGVHSDLLLVSLSEPL